LNPVVNISLTGIGVGAPVPNLVTSLGLVDFGTSTTSIMFELTNTGEADLVVTTIFQPRAPFSISGIGTGTIKTGEKKILTINFSPPTIGVFTSGFTIVSNDPDSLLTFIPLRGTSLAQTVVRMLWDYSSGRRSAIPGRGFKCRQWGGSYSRRRRDVRSGTER
jgi:hypothetical protein